MSTSGELLFLACALVALVTAVLTITMRTPLRAAMALLGHVVSLAGLYLTLHAHLLAAIQLIVYAGAIVVLFVFVIMLIGPGAIDRGVEPRGWMLEAFGAGLLALVSGAIAFAVGDVEGRVVALPACAPGSTDCERFGTVEALSRSLFEGAVIPFELASVLLLVAIVAAVAVARGRKMDAQASLAELEEIRRSPRPFPRDPVGPALHPGKLSTPEGHVAPRPVGEPEAAE